MPATKSKNGAAKGARKGPPAGPAPRDAHGSWRPSPSRPDPIAVVTAGDADRLPELLPVRYGRMLASPFTFYRGSASLMAADLADTPQSGIRVQACGDAHLVNFRGLASPERNIVFDINDFDETLPAPWEWDLKRLVASFVLAMRNNGLSDGDARDAAVRCARSYRKSMREFSKMHVLDLWYLSLDVGQFIDRLRNPKTREMIRQRVEKIASQRGSDMVFPKVASVAHGEVRIRDVPPLIYHPEGSRAPEFEKLALDVLEHYRETLPHERRVLLDRFKYIDAALNVVGVGSVGTRCWIALLMSEANEPLFLQLKQAGDSVLEAYAGKSLYEHHGQRVVDGTRLMQAASDIFLGWTTSSEGVQFYVRQLKDAKIKPRVEIFNVPMFKVFAKACGRGLARAHAKSGDSGAIAGYLGKGDEFDAAMGSFALAYADQAEKDYEALKRAVSSGKIEAYTE
ncbi:MAG: DUF2252 domain-containing protein [Candidatus Baltobacteraceae bacterium]